MSTIASPREPPSRRMPSVQTPTSSRRPSLETSRSVSSSPSRGSAAAAATGAGAAGGGPAAVGGAPGSAGTRRNRAALREYYHIKKPPVLEVTEASDESGRETMAAAAAAAAAADNSSLPLSNNSEVPASEMDAAGFDADAYVRATLQASSLEALLRVYTRVLSETRALDAEKKSLVYDNYSRLITATETIRKMRANMDPLNPMAATLDPAIAHIYAQATALRDDLRAAVPPPAGDAARQAAARARTRRLAAAALATPARLRQLVRAGRADEAAAAWARPRRLLASWRDQGLGGPDVAACLADGEAALRGEPRPAGWTPGG